MAKVIKRTVKTVQIELTEEQLDFLYDRVDVYIDMYTDRGDDDMDNDMRIAEQLDDVLQSAQKALAGENSDSSFDDEDDDGYEIFISI